MPSLRQLYEEYNAKKLVVKVVVAGRILVPSPKVVNYTFSMGDVPTCSFELNGPIAPFIIPKASIIIYVGFNTAIAMVFNGLIESVSPTEQGVNIQGSGQSIKLNRPYKRTVLSTDGVTSSNDLVEQIVAASGVTSYYVNLPSWTPGTAVQQPLQFQTYSEAVNKLAEPFGSPYFEMPTGQVRVQLADPVPAPSQFRTYYSGMYDEAGNFIQPGGVDNPFTQPRIYSGSVETLLSEVRNKVTVRGASIAVIGFGGETTNVVLEEEADAPSPWIDDIDGEPQFVELGIDNELLDTLLDVAHCAARYEVLENRLNQDASFQVDGDPEIFLGATVRIIDPQYTGINARFFVKGYTCAISDTSFTTDLTLIGGRASGSTPRLSPFALFTWTNSYIPIPQNDGNAQVTNRKTLSPLAAKMKQFIPATGADGDPGEPGQGVIVTYDASRSVDPDGRIVLYEWSDTVGHHGTGKVISFGYNPADSGSVDVTLTVTDDDGKTATQVETVNINTFGPTDGYGPDPLSTDNADLSDRQGANGLDGNADDGANGGLASRQIAYVAAEGGAFIVYPDGTIQIEDGVNPYYCVGVTNDIYGGRMGDAPRVVPDANLVVWGGNTLMHHLPVTQSSPGGTAPARISVAGSGKIVGMRLGDHGDFTVMNEFLVMYNSVDAGRNYRQGEIVGGDLSDAIINLDKFELFGHTVRAKYPMVMDNPLGLTPPDPTGSPAQAIFFQFGDEAFIFNAPGGLNYFVPDVNNSSNLSDPTQFVLLLFDNVLIGVAPSMDNDGNYYLVDVNGRFYFGNAYTGFESITSEDFTDIGVVTKLVWEQGMEGTWMLVGTEGIAKTFDGGKHIKAITNLTTNPNPDHNPDPWIYGAIYDIAYLPAPLMTPAADLYTLANKDIE